MNQHVPSEVQPGFWSSIREALRGSHQDFTSGSLNRSILLLAIPMVLELVLESLFAVVDVFWVGRLGANAVATVGLTESMVMMAFSIGLGLSLSTTAMVARRIGEKDPEDAAIAAVQAIVLGLLISVGLGIPAWIFAPRLLLLMGASPAILAMGSGYAHVALGGCGVIIMLFLNNAIFRGAGDAAIAMRLLWVSNIINLILDPCLIFGLGPFPHLGVTGAAVATFTGRGIGVVADVRAFGQDQPAHADIYRPFAQDPFPLIAFTVRTQTDPDALTHAAEQELWRVDANLPVLKAISLRALADQALSVRRASSALISAFAALALLLACIGIYGVMAYAVAQRTQEIGVRMALGARRADVLRMMMAMGTRLILIGIGIGLAGTLACAHVLATILFEVSAVNPLILSLAIALLLAVSLAASWLPAYAASSLDPLQALRTE